MELIVMRLADMHRVHPEQISGRCAGCGHEVAIYPSGQQVMKRHPDVRLTCQVCKTPGPNAALAPGAEFEPFESVKKRKAE
jgi:ribosomal protein S27E